MQNSDELKDLIKENLNEDESILWAGRPTGLKLLDMPYGTSVIIRWIVGLIFVVFGLWYNFIFLPGSNSTGMNGNVFMLVCFLIAIAIALLPLMDINKMKKKCCYYITNQRAISLVNASSDKRIIKEKYYKDISEITSDIFADDRGNIYIGTKLKNSFNKARGEILSPPPSPGEDNLERPLIFHSIAVPDEIVGIFPPLDSSSKE